jgi:hypothetical protein
MGASRLIGAGQWDVRWVDAQEKSAITRSVASGGDHIEQRTLHFNSMRRQEYAWALGRAPNAATSIHHPWKWE